MTTELVKNETNLWKAPRGFTAKTMLPAVDIYETSEEIVLTADMPGVTKETLDVQIEKDTLTLRGKIALEVPEDASPIFAEVNSRTYSRTLTLSNELDTDNITAEMNSGVLTLHIPKKPAVKPRKIEVKSV